MEGASEETVWNPPQINPRSTPRLVALGQLQNDEEYPDNFFRCAKWSPDGTQALAQCEDRTLQLFQLPTELDESTVSQLPKSTVFRQPSPILDFVWYPFASAANPGSCCFLASVRECPVKLLDGITGRLRASYKIVDHRERQVAPHSIAFNSLATHLYCGYEDAIEVFDFQRPGEGTKLATTPSKKSRDGMKGLVSSITFCPDYSGLYAASSLSGAITLFSEQTGEDPVGYLDSITSAITQVKFNPTQPCLLYAAQRRSDELLCWDVRSPYEVLRRFKRKGKGTNQKMTFDLDAAGQWLVSGDEDGYISMFDLLNDASSDESIWKFKAHDDTIGTTTFNPISASLLSVSGSRHFDNSRLGHSKNASEMKSYTISDSDSSSDTDSDSDTDSSGEPPKGEGMYDEANKGKQGECIRGCSLAATRRVVVRRRKTPRRPYVVDASAKVWKFIPDGTVPTHEHVLDSMGDTETGEAAEPSPIGGDGDGTECSNPAVPTVLEVREEMTVVDVLTGSI